MLQMICGSHFFKADTDHSPTIKTVGLFVALHFNVDFITVP